jgi:hypothetical protein
MGKIVVGHFLYGRTSATVPPSLISHASGPLSFPAPSSLTDEARLSVLSSPKSPSSARPRGNTAQIAGDGSATHHHPFVARMPTCAPAALSRRVPSSLVAALLPPVAAPPGMPAPGARRRSLTPPAPLVELTRTKARRLAPDIALSAHAHSYLARVRWHAHVCRVAALIHPLYSSPPRQQRTDKRSLCRLHARLLPL